jgi:hypothetical protein
MMGSPKMPAAPAVPPPPPLPPQLSSTAVSASGQAYQASQASSRGLGATILTGGQGVDQGNQYAAKTLTGQ